MQSFNSFLISCFEKPNFYFLVFQQLSLKLIDNCTSGSAFSACIKISLHEHSILNLDNGVKNGLQTYGGMTYSTNILRYYFQKELSGFLVSYVVTLDFAMWTIYRIVPRKTTTKSNWFFASQTWAHFFVKRTLFGWLARWCFSS